MVDHSPRRPTRRSFLAGTGAIAAGVTLLPSLGRGAEKQLNLYNWDTYIGETTLDDFKKATGVEVKMDLYADNDELFAKLRAGNPGYDVIVRSEEHTSELQSLMRISYAVFCLKKKQHNHKLPNTHSIIKY